LWYSDENIVGVYYGFEGGYPMPAGRYKNPSYNLRIPALTLNKLKYIAAYNGNTANKEIETIVLRHIETFEAENGPITFNDIKLLSKN